MNRKYKTLLIGPVQIIFIHVSFANAILPEKSTV